MDDFETCTKSEGPKVLWWILTLVVFTIVHFQIFINAVQGKRWLEALYTIFIFFFMTTLQDGYN
jgi:ABC-type antimicrobial peptide transport system permease subunit